MSNKSIITTLSSSIKPTSQPVNFVLKSPSFFSHVWLRLDVERHRKIKHNPSISISIRPPPPGIIPSSSSSSYLLGFDSINTKHGTQSISPDHVEGSSIETTTVMMVMTTTPLYYLPSLDLHKTVPFDVWLVIKGTAINFSHIHNTHTKRFRCQMETRNAKKKEKKNA